MRAASFLSLLLVALVALVEAAPAPSPAPSSVTSTLSAAGQNPNGLSIFFLSSRSSQWTVTLPWRCNSSPSPRFQSAFSSSTSTKDFFLLDAAQNRSK